MKGTTMVPLRFCGIRALGCEVQWDGNECTDLQQNNTRRTMRLSAWSF
ncbi:copper amine oxidase N-terminal domain-containing protein [Paenibacillus sp. EZ-K15]|nr:copper amine oxidase N-terminal domain-containing protein [Paenibacillus sp. EZ-K15]